MVLGSLHETRSGSKASSAPSVPRQPDGVTPGWDAGCPRPCHLDRLPLSLFWD